MATSRATPPEDNESIDSVSPFTVLACYSYTPSAPVEASRSLVTGQTDSLLACVGMARQRESPSISSCSSASKRPRLAHNRSDAREAVPAITARNIASACEPGLNCAAPPGVLTNVPPSVVSATLSSTPSAGPNEGATRTGSRNHKHRNSPDALNVCPRSLPADGRRWELNGCGVGPHQATSAAPHAAVFASLNIARDNLNRNMQQLGMRFDVAEQLQQLRQQQPSLQQLDIDQLLREIQAPSSPTTIPSGFVPSWFVSGLFSATHTSSCAGFQVAGMAAQDAATALPQLQSLQLQQAQLLDRCLLRSLYIFGGHSSCLPAWTGPSLGLPPPFSQLQSQLPPPQQQPDSQQQPHSQQQHEEQQQQQPGPAAFAPTTPPRCVEPQSPACARDYILRFSGAFTMRPETTVRLALHIWSRIQGMVQLVISTRQADSQRRMQQSQRVLPNLSADRFAAHAASVSANIATGSERVYAVAALWLAAKLEERRREVPSVRLLSSAARTGPGVLAEAELRILQWCEWAPYLGFVHDESYLLTDL